MGAAASVDGALNFGGADGETPTGGMTPCGEGKLPHPDAHAALAALGGHGACPVRRGARGRSAGLS